MSGKGLVIFDEYKGLERFIKEPEQCLNSFSSSAAVSSLLPFSASATHWNKGSAILTASEPMTYELDAPVTRTPDVGDLIRVDGKPGVYRVLPDRQLELVYANRKAWRAHVAQQRKNKR